MGNRKTTLCLSVGRNNFMVNSRGCWGWSMKGLSTRITGEHKMRNVATGEMLLDWWKLSWLIANHGCNKSEDGSYNYEYIYIITGPVFFRVYCIQKYDWTVCKNKTNSDNKFLLRLMEIKCEIVRYNFLTRDAEIPWELNCVNVDLYWVVKNKVKVK